MKKTNLFKTLALFLLMPTLIITGCEKEHTHDYGTLVEKVDATCTTMGHEAYYHCEECDKYFDASKQETTLESLQIGMKDHVWQTVAGQSATCEQEGHTEKIYCTLCGQVREESHVINPTGHAYGQWTITTSPTLVATGVAQRVCGNDNSHVDTYTLPALTDSSFWTKSTFNPTCTQDGKEVYTNATYGSIEVTLNKTGHNFGAWSIVVNPTNDQTGKAQRVCANDNGHIDEVVLPVLTEESVWTKANTPATCEEDGSNVYTSTYGTVTVKLNKTGHAYGDWTITTNPTTETTGEARKVCANDANHVETKTLLVLTDETVWSKTTTPSTCTVKGKDSYASVYGTVEVELSLAEHTYDWVIDQAATKLATGLKHEECTACHQHRNDNTVIEIETCDHENVTKTDAVAETCTTAGNKEYYYCEDCHKYFQDAACTNQISDVETWKVIPAKNHSYGAWTLTTNPTEEVVGSAKRICANDANHEDVVEVPVLTNTTVWSLVTVPATCTTNGTKTYSSIYGTVVIDLLAFNHDWNDWQVVQPTADAEGSASRTCKNDEANHSEQVTLPVINDENYTIVTQAATCTATGLTTYTLKSNTSISFSVVLEKIDHSYTVKEETEQYLKSAADCEHAAVYYQHCSCGAIDAGHTYTKGSALGHIYTYEVNGNTVTEGCSRTGCSHSVVYTALTSAEANTQAKALEKGKFSATNVCVKGVVQSVATDKGRKTIVVGSTVDSADGFTILRADISEGLTVSVGCEIIAWGYLNNYNNSLYRMANNGLFPLVIYSYVPDCDITSTHTSSIECTINGLPSTAKLNSEVSFTVTVTDSTNYKIDYVTVNGIMVTADGDGNYKFTVGQENAVVINLIGIDEEFSATKYGTADNPNNIEKAWTIANGLADGGFSVFQGYVTGYVKEVSGSAITLVDDLSNAEAKTFKVYGYAMALDIPTPVVGEKITANGFYQKYVAKDSSVTMELATYNDVKPEVKSIDEYITLTVGTPEILFDGEASAEATVTNVTGLDGENHITSHNAMTFNVNVNTGYKIFSVKYDGEEVMGNLNNEFALSVTSSSHVIVVLVEDEDYEGTVQTISRTASSLQSEYNWGTSGSYTNTFALDNIITISGSGKSYSSWNTYANDSFTISSREGFIIDSVQFKVNSNAIYFKIGSNALTAATDYAVNATNVTVDCSGTSYVNTIIVKYHATSSKYDAIDMALKAVENPFTGSPYTSDTELTVDKVANEKVTVNKAEVDYEVAYNWTFDKDNATYDNGKINISVLNDEARTIVATLTASLGKKSLTKSFTFSTVSKYDEALKNISVDFASSYTEATDVNLDYECGYNDLTIVWASNSTYAVVADNKVAITVPSTGSEDVTLTATIDGTSKSKTFTFTVTSDAGSTFVGYEMVTDITKLKVNDEIIIVYQESATSTSGFALGAQSEKIRSKVDITITNNKIASSTLPNTVQVFTIKAGSEANSWAFYTGSKYLYASGGTANNKYLQETDTLNSTSSWTISMANTGLCTIQVCDSTVNCKYLKYNASSPRFTCYASGQKDVYIYKKVG